jgi:DNA modification methylase
MFAGSATTLVVAKKLGRRFIGCELNPGYVKLAKERLKVAGN